MSFSFFKPSRPKTPQEVAKAIKDSLVALDTKTVVEVKALEKVSISPFLSFLYIMHITKLLLDSWFYDHYAKNEYHSLGIVDWGNLDVEILLRYCLATPAV